MENRSGIRRKVKEGTVVSTKMEKTVTVRVERQMKHPDFDKVVTRAKRYLAHNEIEGIEPGQRVRIMETRPLSKLKRWKVVEVIGK